ncbi:hypothetical protein Tco_1084164, partial [Tanacetum coccineum]
MNTTQAQQKALDDALVAPADRLEFEKCNMRLKTDIKLKEATFQVVLDALALTPFYKAFLITVEVPAIYMQEFWATVSVHKHEDTQVYGIILPQHLTNQAMLESKAYKRYYAFAFGEKTPKPKYFRKKVDSDTSPKNKPVQATKGTRLKTKAKLATKRKKTQFHISHASGLGDGVDTHSKVPDEQQQKVTGINKGAGVRPEVPDVPKYDSESEEESWTFSQDDEYAKEESDMNDDSEETEFDNDEDDLTHPNLSTYKAKDQEEEKEDDEVSSDQRVNTPLDYEPTDEEQNQKVDDKVKEGEEEEEEDGELYKDLNLNLVRNDAEMTN